MVMHRVPLRIHRDLFSGADDRKYRDRRRSGVIAPLAIGAILMVMIYAGGHVSGAHYNPAVTLAVFMRGKCPAADVVPYMVAQIAGAVTAAAAVMFIKTGEPVAPFYAKVAPALAAELLFTFALCYVVLNVATARATSGNSVLWPRDRIHGACRGLCRRRRFGRGVQPGRRRRRVGDGAVALGKYLALPGRGFSRWCACGARLQCDQC